MARIPEEIIQSITDSADIVDVVQEFVSLKRSGQSFKGLCPFHDEKTPSFHVFAQSGRYKCFGCDEGGNAIHFLMKRTGASFRDVCQQLADAAGIVIPSEPESPQAAEAAAKRREAMDALKFAAAFYRAVLRRDTGSEARRYLEDRAFTAETLKLFEIGFSPDRFDGLLGEARKRGFSERALFDAGLVRRNESRGSLYDMFRGRIMFPIYDLRGSVIAFGARAMGDAQPKYLNSHDGPTFRKGREIYGLHLARDPARKAGRLLLVEGYTDVMHCHQAGVREVAAGLGTALTPDNASQLKRFGVPVVLLYDGDAAGRNAASRAAETLLAHGVEGSVALLPSGQDPADWIQEHGAQGLDSLLAEARDLWAYRMEFALEKHDPSTLDGGKAAADELIRVVEQIDNDIRRDLALKLLSERLGLSESTLRNTIRPRKPRPSPPRDGNSMHSSPGNRSGVSGRGNGQAVAQDRPAAGQSDAISPAWLRMEGDFIVAGWLDSSLWESVVATHPPARWSDPVLCRIAGAMEDLRRRGESFGREALLSEWAEAADAEDALSRILEFELDQDACARTAQHLQRLVQRARTEAARHQREDPLAAVVRARGGHLVEDRQSNLPTEPEQDDSGSLRDTDPPRRDAASGVPSQPTQPGHSAGAGHTEVRDGADEREFIAARGEETAPEVPDEDPGRFEEWDASEERDPPDGWDGEDRWTNN